MARSQKKLSDTYCRSGKLKAGRHSDGGGLYLAVSDSGNRSWVFMWSVGGRRREMGLGRYPDISLSEARRKTEECRSVVASGGDPITARDRPEEPSFGACATEFIEFRESDWKNQKHRDQWRMTLLGPGDETPRGRKPAPDYCAPIRRKRVSEVTTADVLAILQPIWRAKHETASRIRGRIEIVLDYAKGKGWRTGENPAAWKGNLAGYLKNPPSAEKLSRGHHAALDYRELPEFISKLCATEGLSARALEFTILTGVRSGEALGARWDEIDFDAALWTIPGARMKAGRVHRVPLSEPALAILKPLKEAALNEFVFPGQRRGSHLSGMAMAMVLRRLEVPVTVHGFRSTFRDRAGETTTFPREVCELVLAHTVANEVERAYQRGDLFDKRKRLMTAWAGYCRKGESRVIQFAKTARE